LKSHPGVEPEGPRPDFGITVRKVPVWDQDMRARAAGPKEPVEIIMRRRAAEMIRNAW
jgi:hypothetical protein